MQGDHDFQPELFVQIDYQVFIPNDHMLRRIHNVLDLRFVKQLTQQFYSARQGRPSIDPEVFFRICILGYIYGIKSDRQLCDEIRMNIGYRWFVGLNLSDTVPDHSSLTRIRERLGVACFAVVFEQVVEQCRRAGLVDGKRIITDASLVEANASARKLERREQPVAVADEKQPSEASVSPTMVVKREPVSTGTQVGQIDGAASSVAASASVQKLARREQPTVADEKHQSNEAVSPTAVMKRAPVSPDMRASQVDGEASSVVASASAQKLEKREQTTAAVEVANEKHHSKKEVSPTRVAKREQVSPDMRASQVDGEASSVAASASAQKLEKREQTTAAVEVANEKHHNKKEVSPTRVAKRERISNRTHVSKVDRDATLVNRAGYPMQLYHKVHYCIDANSRVITDCHVTTGADHENTVIRGRIEYQQARFGFPIEEVIADAGYSSGKNYQFFEEQQICSYIPMPRHVKPVADNGSFEYDPKQDHYTCQAGHVLAAKHAVRSTKYYYIKKAHCKECQWQNSCYLGVRVRALPEISISRRLSECKAVKPIRYFNKDWRSGVGR